MILFPVLDSLFVAHAPVSPVPKNMEEVCKLAKCSICKELKPDHRILASCGHSFCREDIDAIIINSYNIRHSCPVCREPFEVPQHDASLLKKDWNKIALTEIVLKWKNEGKAMPKVKKQVNTICCECFSLIEKACIGANYTNRNQN